MYKSKLSTDGKSAIGLRVSAENRPKEIIMKRIILAIILILSLSLVGCYSTPVVNPALVTESKPVIESEPIVESEPSVIEPQTSTETTNNTTITYVDDRGIPVLPEGFGIQGVTAEFDGVYPGWAGTIHLTLVNGLDRDRMFVIYAVSSAKTKEGYEPLPEEYLYWITVEEPEVAISKGQNRQVNITLEIPSDADYAGKHAEVRIRVDDITQTGLVQIALESKWYIITAE